MILVFRLVPAAVHDEEPTWAYPGYFLNDESELTPLPDGEWAIFKPTQTTVDREASNELPQSWKFDRIVNTTTPTAKSSIRTAK